MASLQEEVIWAAKRWANCEEASGCVKCIAALKKAVRNLQRDNARELKESRNKLRDEAHAESPMLCDEICGFCQERAR